MVSRKLWAAAIWLWHPASSLLAVLLQLKKYQEAFWGSSAVGMSLTHAAERFCKRMCRALLRSCDPRLRGSAEQTWAWQPVCNTNEALNVALDHSQMPTLGL